MVKLHGKTTEATSNSEFTHGQYAPSALGICACSYSFYAQLSSGAKCITMEATSNSEFTHHQLLVYVLVCIGPIHSYLVGLMPEFWSECSALPILNVDKSVLSILFKK